MKGGECQKQTRNDIGKLKKEVKTMQNPPYSLRIDPKLLEEIKKNARKSRRTLNKEIEMMLDYYLKEINVKDCQD